MTKEQFDKAVTLNRHINRVTNEIKILKECKNGRIAVFHNDEEEFIPFTLGEKMRQEIINLIDLHLNARLTELRKQFEEL